MKTTSIGLKKYMLTYLCSKTEYSFVYFLKKKNEQFEKFKEFQKYYELLSNKKIKELRTDNGKEYFSNEIIQYLKNAGIKHNTSPEYCPESNGKAERLNRTIITKARCMMISLNVSLHLWTAAVDTANYIRNRSPLTVLNGQTPYEALFKKLPNINHLKIFGCAAYPLNNDKQRDKFHPTAF
jgi:transposase InsO family protein